MKAKFVQQGRWNRGARSQGAGRSEGMGGQGGQEPGGRKARGFGGPGVRGAIVHPFFVLIYIFHIYCHLHFCQYRRPEELRGPKSQRVRGPGGQEARGLGCLGARGDYCPRSKIFFSK